ncbi:MAG: BMP family ABC transporter substrate-binding protein [Clostridiales bacterium]|nr:BMP family ABC transporter substrate-binding protein [Clostridiales bacterium]
MIPANAKEEYVKARNLALKEKKELEAAGLSPYPAVLDEVFPGALHANPIELPVQEIPADRIIGTVSAGRISAFSASFLPLPEADSEFAMKWTALLSAHLSDAGIRDPIECYEYLGDFYVSEGNKRVSVLRYFGAVRIPAKIRRVLPEDISDPANAAYAEFLDFYAATGVYDIRFARAGDFARLLSAVGKKPGEAWSETEIRKLVSTFHLFKEAFLSVGGKGRELMPEDALLLFLKVYPYGSLTAMTQAEIKKALLALRGDVKTASEPEAIQVKTLPDDEEKSVISKLISGTPRHLDIAFICQKDPERSSWTKGHAEGAAYLAEALPEQTSVKVFFGADTDEDAERLIEEAVKGGAELVFTTTPPLISAALRSAVKYPKVRFYNCSACQPFSSVKSYYCRTYEGKFITGLIAGALADNDLVGYVGSYPIYGVPASINAFAVGVRMTNPRAKILLEWSCMEVDCVRKLREKGVKVISNRDVPVPDVNYLKQGWYGTFVTDGEGGLSPVASPCWVWGMLYENIVRSLLSGSTEKKEQAVNYWWGMDSGVIDVAISELVPPGVRALAETFIGRLKKGGFDVFAQKLYAQDGSLISDGITPLSSMDVLKMDKLCEAVTGHIPEYEEIFPFSRALVRALGVHRDRIPPQAGE